MNLSIEIYTLREKFGDIKAIEMIKKAGFDAIDYSYYGTENNPEILGDNYRQYAKKIKECLDQTGLFCNQAHAPWGVRYGSDFDCSHKEYLDIVRSLESASILGAKNIVVHSIAIPPEEINVDFEEYNFQYYKSLEPYCEKFGIKIAVENLFSYDDKCKCYRGRLSTPKTLCNFIDKLNSPWFVACIDVGHAAISEVKPEHFISGMKKGVLKALHIHDNDYTGDNHVLPFLGNIDWYKVIKALKRIDYDGELTFEILSFLEKFPDELMMSALHFSHDTGRYLISNFSK